MGSELMPYSAQRRDRLEEDLANHRELAYRRDHGIEVFLYWHKKTNVLSIMLTDINANQSQNFTVPNDKGLDAFYHPYVYAPNLTERTYDENDGA